MKKSEVIMGLRSAFDDDVHNYDRFRPRYTAELFRNIIRYASLNGTKKVLEIGIGTGQATLPFLKAGCHVVAIDAGENLAIFSANTFSSFPRFHVQHVTFEAFVADDNTFDFIFSATAFHWIAQDVGLKKIRRLLKPGGIVALFWNHPFVNRKNNALHRQIQSLYKAYWPEGTPPVEFSEHNLTRYRDVLTRYGFCDVSARLYHATRELGAEDYIHLLNTYSDHRSLENKIKMELESAVSAAIICSGGKLTVYDTMDLYLARKPSQLAE